MLQAADALEAARQEIERLQARLEEAQQDARRFVAWFGSRGQDIPAEVIDWFIQRDLPYTIDNWRDAIDAALAREGKDD